MEGLVEEGAALGVVGFDFNTGRVQELLDYVNVVGLDRFG